MVDRAELVQVQQFGQLVGVDTITFVSVFEQSIFSRILQERIRQRIQRIMLAAPRAKSIREAEKVFLVNLVEDGGHGLLHQLVFQGRNPQWALSSICFLYVHSSRWLRPIRSTMNSAMEIDQSIFNSDFIFLPGDPVHSGYGFSLE